MKEMSREELLKQTTSISHDGSYHNAKALVVRTADPKMAGNFARNGQVYLHKRQTSTIDTTAPRTKSVGGRILFYKKFLANVIKYFYEKEFKRIILRGKTAVFVDWANVYGWKKSLKSEVNISVLYKYLKSYEEIVEIYLYFEKTIILNQKNF